MLDFRALPLYILLLAVHITVIAAIPPIRPPRVNPPEPLVIPKPVSPHINPANPRIGEDVPPAQQTVVAYNMQRLEERLETIQQGLELGTELIQAIFSTGTKSSNGQTTATITREATQSTTATKTLNMSLFGMCKSYASTLSSCASATSNFFALDPTQQASCACYTLVAMTSGSCASVPTLVTGSVYAEACQSFFSVNGFSEVASVMSDGGNVAGVGFCGALDAKLAAQTRMRNATGPTGLESMLEPTACVVSRTAVATPTSGVAGLVEQVHGGVLVVMFAVLTTFLGMVV